MKTFKDLVFEPWSESKASTRFENHKQAVMAFENRYGISVLFGNSFYSNGIDTYEIAILLDDEICYSTDITNDVIGHLSEEEVTGVMAKIQSL